MPVIEVNLNDFISLLGVKVSREELMEKLPMMGTSWEGETSEGFNLEVFPNRPDLLSIEGLVRAFTSFNDLKSGFKEYNAKKGNYTVDVYEKVKNVRPYFVSSVVKNIDFDDSLIRSIIQLQEKLHVTHGRKRRKVAIGLHNLEPIQFPVIYTTKSQEFKFRPLGERYEKSLEEILTKMPKGEEYAWILEGKKEYPILMDSKGMVLSMPPIINSEHTRIDEATENIFVDITGTDWKAINETLNIISTTFADRGAEIFSVENHYADRIEKTPNFSPKVMSLEIKYVSKLLGLDLSCREIIRCLENMGYGVKKGDPLEVMIPCYRTDIMHPIDLVEDVAISYGYNDFIPVIPDIASKAGEDLLEVFSRNLRNFLIGFGFLEVVTFMMSNREKLFEKMNMPEEPLAETENPKMEGYRVLRNSLLPSLMEVLSTNTHHPYPQNLYEIDDVILMDKNADTASRASRRLAIVLCHAKANFSETKSVMNCILENLKTTADIKALELPCFIKGRQFAAISKGRKLCWGGEIRPEVIGNWGLEMPVAALEMDVDLLFDLTIIKS
jgi:phenylalanyl-tRNA synthetase beta chain